MMATDATRPDATRIRSCAPPAPGAARPRGHSPARSLSGAGEETGRLTVHQLRPDPSPGGGSSHTLTPARGQAWGPNASPLACPSVPPTPASLPPPFTSTPVWLPGVLSALTFGQGTCRTDTLSETFKCLYSDLQVTQPCEIPGSHSAIKTTSPPHPAPERKQQRQQTSVLTRGNFSAPQSPSMLTELSLHKSWQ